ncbi:MULTISPECIES: sigma-70 factor domain-containing protein [unclassified Nostoc]|uniref:sigma-70 factor domain-containing protein n=1 Tax=unclassified Nostoc TaxID=2593658 RepID=UPI001FB0D087|nr:MULTISPECIES: sigma-70 factor domain-containing protein [unclassified Nostoc]
MVRIYLQEIGRYPMLTADQEIAYGRQVQQIMAIEQRKNELTQQLDREPTMVELNEFVKFSSKQSLFYVVKKLKFNSI